MLGLLKNTEVNSKIKIKQIVQTYLGFDFTSLVIRMSLSFWYREDIFHMEISSAFFFFLKKEIRMSFLSHPLAQNSQDARAVYFGVMCSDSFNAITSYWVNQLYHWLYVKDESGEKGSAGERDLKHQLP